MEENKSKGKKKDTSDENGLEGMHTRKEGVDNVHGDGSIIDVGSGVNNLFVSLVSKVHQCV